ncbi:aspartate/glutamate/uridylate kinase [Ignicoccus hospitalis KIN4/I]|uniref:Isopentenyl phosphate kinase n=1 Tax=Ignicoccus hospitalis (strain KIN4/I / DSM 18386 / JCM 14125) TaxID=453591 RepID=A8A9Z6_IGNH4|nr:aspartate/glutamate/uridylate kinase [Ignicoccus hospitalis KIN4/I]HIH90015.1 hypothetical protein [Desulfurococcaceae archaeon]
MIVIKLGGSVISNKKVPYSLNKELIGKIGNSLREYAGELVVVHGGGSFGHPKVKEIIESGHTLADKGFEVIRVMNLMTNLVVEALGQPFAPYSTPSLWDGRLNVRPLALAAKAGWVPVVQGNVVPPGRVLSGDEIVVELVKELGAERAGVATDVDGVYETWPPKGGPLKEASPCDVEAKGSEGIDVTGGMRKKLEVLEEAARYAEVCIFNGLKVVNFEKFLKGECPGTRVVPCRQG